MKISLVTPVFNDPRICHALDSILAQQTNLPLEIIVIDGGSTDSTLDVIEQYRHKIAMLVSEPDNGPYDAMNKGIRLATGDVIGILNADDRYQSNSVLLDVMNVFQDKSVDACYGDLVYVNDDDNIIRHWVSGRFHRSKLYFGWIPPHPTVFVRKQVYDNYGLLNLKFSISADYELLLRLLMKHNVRTAYLNKTLVRMALGGVSNRSLRNIARGNIEAAQAWRENNLPFGYMVPLLKPAQKIIQLIRRT